MQRRSALDGIGNRGEHGSVKRSKPRLTRSPGTRQAVLACLALVWLGIREGRELGRAASLWADVSDARFEQFFKAGLVKIVETVRALSDERVCGVRGELTDYEIQRFSEMLYPKAFLLMSESDVQAGALVIRSTKGSAPEDAVILTAGTLQVSRRAP